MYLYHINIKLIISEEMELRLKVIDTKLEMRKMKIITS